MKLAPNEAEKLLGNVEDEKSFKLHMGADIKSLHELAELLDIMNDESFNHHVTKDKNDFAKWVHDVIGDKELYKNIVHVKTREHMINIVNARVKELERLAERGKGWHTEEVMAIGIRDFAIGMVIGLTIGIIARQIFLLIL